MTAIVSEIFANVIFLVVPEKYFQDINVLGMFISKLFLLLPLGEGRKAVYYKGVPGRE